MVGTCGGCTASRAPRSSAVHTSNVDASKESEANCATVSPGRTSVYPLASASRTTARCGVSTPLGTPVEPEVYMT